MQIARACSLTAQEKAAPAEGRVGVYTVLVRRIFCALGAVAFAACVDFGELSGGSDASTPDDDATFADTSADVSDAGIQDSGFPDIFVPPLVDASFCASVDATFCDDFDTVALAVRWDSLYTRAGGNVVQSPNDAAPSEPNTLLTTIPGGDAATEYTRAAFLSKTITGNFTHFDVAFDIHSSAPGDNGAMLPIEIFGNGTTVQPESYLGIYMWPHMTYAIEQHDFSDGGALAFQSPNWFTQIQLTAWHRVEISIDLATDGGVAHLTETLDGTVVQTFVMNPLWTLGPSVLVAIGDTSPYSSFSSWEIRFDNVTIDAN